MGAATPPGCPFHLLTSASSSLQPSVCSSFQLFPSFGSFMRAVPSLVTDPPLRRPLLPVLQSCPRPQPPAPHPAPPPAPSPSRVPRSAAVLAHSACAVHCYDGSGGFSAAAGVLPAAGWSHVERVRVNGGERWRARAALPGRVCLIRAVSRPLPAPISPSSCPLDAGKMLGECIIMQHSTSCCVRASNGGERRRAARAGVFVCAVC